MNPINDVFGFDPMAELGAYRDAMRQLFEEGWTPRDLAPSSVASVLVPIDLLDVGPDLIVRANMPGVKAENLAITLTGNTLTLKGEIKAEVELEGATYLRRERRATTFSRSLVLPMDVNADQAEAKFHDGVLTLSLPKSESVRPKTIKVTAG
jgi:HSP20 family protein